MKGTRKEKEIKNEKDLANANAIVVGVKTATTVEVSNAGMKYCDFKVQLEKENKQILRWANFRGESHDKSFRAVLQAQSELIWSQG